MINSALINKTIKSQLNQKEAGYAISLPVLHKKNDIFYIACFATIINPINFDDTLPRPEFWILADLSDATVKDFIDCRQQDFSPATHNRNYNISTDFPAPLFHFDEIYKLFDLIRSDLIENGILNRRLYKLYLKKLTKYVPLPYRKFFRDLSI